jgi:two-component system KDP operon response regulator KdpE
MSGPRILVVEDESSVSKFLRHSLEANGFTVDQASTGEEALRMAADRPPVLVILDFGLPDITGVEVIRRLRAWSEVPVLFLSANSVPEDKVAALDAGADDYLTKPFSVPELMARIRVGLRHAQKEKGASLDPLRKVGPVELDLAAHTVRVNGQSVKFSATEYALLALLVKHAGKVLSHRQILKEVWGPNSVDHHHYLRVYFGMVRKKLEAACPGSGDLIENELGIGYRLKAD